MDEELRAEAVRRAKADQAAVERFLVHAAAWDEDRPEGRSPWPYCLLELGDRPAFAQRVLDVVHDNVAWLRGVVDEIGWPGQDVIDRDGADAVWLILQHAGSGVPTIGIPDNLAFQTACLPLLQDAVQRGAIHPRHFAHVSDHLFSAYGLQPLAADLVGRRGGHGPGTWPEPWPLPRGDASLRTARRRRPPTTLIT